MAGLFKKKTFAEGETIFKEGDPPDAVYMVESGLVDMTIRRISGEDMIIGTIGPGEMFGEMALIDNQPRMATAKVAMETRLVVIPPEAFRAQLKTVNPIMSKVMVQLTKRLRSMAQEIAIADKQRR
ncbi:MAG: cyclic nucleotide-binding domain-containing protein [Rhodospirillaceae bacterium]